MMESDMKDLNGPRPSEERATEAGSSADQRRGAAQEVIDIIDQARKDSFDWVTHLEPYREAPRKDREAASAEVKPGKTELAAQKCQEVSTTIPKMKSEEVKQRKAEARDRMAAESRGNSRPLFVLATREAALQAHSAARANLPQGKPHPDRDLLAYQLTASVDVPFSGHLRKKMKDDAMRLYAALDSRNVDETIENRVLVAITNATMGCFARAVATHQSQARNIDLRYGIKGAEAIGSLLKLRDARRGRGPQSVTVGTVKVESGGQAIVGNVNAGKNRTEDETDDRNS